jgi:hypothetical protein
MVRGLDYYTRTTFEFVHDGLGAQSGIGGGGRYDRLMAELGGQSLPGIGFGLGVDRILLSLQAEGVPIGDESSCDVYCVPLGDAAKARLVVAAGALRAAGVRVDIAYGGKGLKGAMKAADRSGARFGLVLGERDLAEGVVQLKDMASGDQTPVPLGTVVGAVQQALGRSATRPPGVLDTDLVGRVQQPVARSAVRPTRRSDAETLREFEQVLARLEEQSGGVSHANLVRGLEQVLARLEERPAGVSDAGPADPVEQPEERPVARPT